MRPRSPACRPNVATACASASSACATWPNSSRRRSGAAAGDFLRHLEPAQEALGRLNDEQVAQAQYRQLAAKHPKAWFAVGWLAARRESLLAECERALRRLKEGPEVRKGGFRQAGDGVRIER